MIEKFAFTYQGTRNGCTICGGCIEKFEVYVAAIENHETYATVCPRCIAKPGKIDEKLEQRAVEVGERGRRHALKLREAVGQIRNLPSLAQWEAESEFINAAYDTDLKREQWDAWTPEQQQAWKDWGQHAWRDRDPTARALVPEINRPTLSDEEFEEFNEMVGKLDEVTF